MKWIKRLFLLAVVVLLLAVVGLTAFVMTFNPNDYKPQIERLVKEKTGRTLNIDGKMSLTIYPRLGLRLAKVSLSNPAGFDTQKPFASIDRLDLDVELMPLLRRKLVVDRVVLSGLDVNLVRKADGSANWQGLAGAAAKSAPAPASTPAQPSAAGVVAGAPFALAVAGVEVQRARITLDDKLVGRRLVMAPLDLSVGHLAPGRSAPIKLDFHIENSKPALGLDGRMTAQLSADLAAARYRLNNIDLKLSAKGDAVPKGAIETTLQGSLDVDLVKGGRIVLKPLKLSVNGSQLTGNVDVTDLAHPHIAFALALDQLDADQYLPPPPPPAKGGSGGTPAAPAPWSDKPLAIPLGELRRVNADGTLSIGKLTARKLKLSQVKLALSARDGLLRVSDMSADLYGGTFKGAASLDARRATPTMSVKAALGGIQIGDLLKDYAGDRYLTGKTDIKADLDTRGLSERALVGALGGSLSLAVHDGSVQRSRLADQIQSVLIKLRELKQGSPVGPPGAETRFASLTATAQVGNGVIDNRDLKLDAIRFAANGSGTVDLLKREIDYALRFTQANGKGTPIPLLIRGPLHHPGYEIDLKSMAKDALQQRLNQERQKAGEQIKQKLEKALPGLKGLFK
ncbi:AsmA family protein [Acidihalobacter prosperus]|uniref:AsmA domain-containing protein n=1 Tax=Acidihalobacter prosperus TaxID=160660 RepID=A0A1A6C1B5_9GAMM|nr:AsmA family protein [Acidihalobacter prosperus]OBS08356.1 hypothetical protein Thpro_022606 [Acidihalobacter prosperus]